MTWSGYSEKGQGSQERGPGSFAVDVPGVVQGAAGVEFQPVRAGGDMQSSGRLTVGNEFEADRTFGELYKLLQPIAQKKAAERKDELFVEGMARAASGIGMQEIIAEQGTFSKLFGDAPAVDGARAYTVAARKSKWIADQTNRMPDLAKISEEAIPGLVTASITESLTGDPGTDTMLQKELLAAAPDLIRQHTKARYVHLQGEAKTARRGAMLSSYEAYGAGWATTDGTLAADQMDRLEQGVIDTWTPPPGVDEESHMDDIKDTLVQSVKAGNFDALRLAYDAGLVKRLGPERVDALRAAALTAAPAALRKVASEPAVLSGLLELARGDFPDEEHVKKWNALNDLAAGVSRVPREYGELLDSGDLTRGILAGDNAKKVGQQKAAAEAVKAVTLDAIIDETLNNKDLSGSAVISSLQATNTGIKITDKEADNALGGRYASTSDPVAQATLLNRFPGNKVTLAVDTSAAMVNSFNRDGAKWETHGATFDKALRFYSELTPEMQRVYFPGGMGDMMDSLVPHYKGLDRLAPEYRAQQLQALYETRDALSRANTSRLRPEPDKGSAQAVARKTLEKSMTTGLFRIDEPMGMDAGGGPDTDISDYELLAMTSIVTGLMAQETGPAPADIKAARAQRAAFDRGLVDVAGGRLILNEVPDEALETPLWKHTGLPADTSARVLNDIITEKVASRKADNATRLVIRARGLPIKYVVYMTNDNGQEIIDVVTGDEVRDRARQGKPKTEVNMGPAP